MRAPLDDLRVLVADDHALYRRGLVMELDDAEDLEVVAEAADGQEAVEEALSLAPDVVLMDVRMPGMDGIEATRRILESAPTVRVLMLSVSDDTDDLVEAVKAGAAGYLLKETSISDIAVRRDAWLVVTASSRQHSPEGCSKSSRPWLGENRARPVLADR